MDFYGLPKAKAQGTKAHEGTKARTWSKMRGHSSFSECPGLGLDLNALRNLVETLGEPSEEAEVPFTKHVSKDGQLLKKKKKKKKKLPRFHCDCFACEKQPQLCCALNKFANHCSTQLCQFSHHKS